jgi:hypothetical protein
VLEKPIGLVMERMYPRGSKFRSRARSMSLCVMETLPVATKTAQATTKATPSTTTCSRRTKLPVLIPTTRHFSIRKKCSLSILPLRPLGIVDAIINDAGDLSAEQVTTALLEKFARKCFTLGHAFHRGRSSGQYWVRFGYIIYPLPLTLPVRSAPDETPSFTVQPANLETCDICKLPRSQRSCECQVQLIAHEDVCSEVDGYALRREVRRQEKIVRRAGRRELSLLWV